MFKGTDDKVLFNWGSSDLIYSKPSLYRTSVLRTSDLSIATSWPNKPPIHRTLVDIIYRTPNKPRIHRSLVDILGWILKYTVGTVPHDNIRLILMKMTNLLLYISNLGRCTVPGSNPLLSNNQSNISTLFGV